MDLPTLHSILSEYEIKSSKTFSCFNKLYKDLTVSVLMKCFEQVFELEIATKFRELNSKHKSCLSRELVTVVLDDSVFKQWLGAFKVGESFDSCYGCFFSGQFKSSVYGFKDCCIGVVIDKVYYPMYFEYTPKQKKEEGDEYSVGITTAIKLVERFGLFYEGLKTNSIDLGNLKFSVDNGYSHMALAKICKKNHLDYISVPKKSHTFLINGQKFILSKWIETEFLQLEEEHNLKQERLQKEQQEPFIYRFKGFYCSKKTSVVLLAFRLNGSKKVSIIYTTAKDEKAKTLRRHWFQRTYIEQFYKIMKHVLKIQESRTRDKDSFSYKFLRFAFIGLHIQKLVRFIRKRMKSWGNKGFISIQRIIRNDALFKDLLQNELFDIY